MKALFSLQTRSFRKAMLLMGVYVLQLVFFQALMEAAPSYNIDSSFKTLFTHQNNHVSHNIPGAKHPAVTYYSMLVKQGNNIGDVCGHINPVVNNLEATITPILLSKTFHINQTEVGHIHQADDVFKVYRLNGVFLV